MEYEVLIREPSGEQKWLPVSEVFRIARRYKKPTPTPVGTLVGFQEWWNLYNNKKGRSKSETSWKNNVKPKLIPIIMKHSKEYVNSTPDKQFRKHPSTYLNNHCWNDEITTQEKKINLDELYPFDKTGSSRLGRCSKCNSIVFGNKFTIHKDDSDCCKAKIKGYTII
jgi:hypothetical protein